MTNEETREHMDMLIAHKDKALETHPYFKRCDSCIHSEEQDGSSCYECVKGMTDNFEAQPTSDNDIIKALKAIRTIHNGNYATQIDEAIRRLEAQSTDEDCISRSELLRHQHIIYDDDEEGYNVVYVKDIKAMPPVTPTSEDIKEAYLKGYDYGVKDWFKSKTQPCEDYNWKALWHQVKKERDIAISQLHELGYEFGEKIETCEDCVSREAVKNGMIKYGFHAPDMTVTEFVEDCLPPVTPKYTDEEIDRAQAVEQAYVDKMVELAVEKTKRPKGKWNFIGDQMFECSSCKRTYTQNQFEELRIYTTDDLLPRFCPNCGAEMED